jgi:AbrB family looped-hinge helix DNA binding protein
MDTRILQVRQRGTLTLPAGIRDRYGLEDGDPLTLVDLDGAILLSPRVSVIGKLAAEIEYLRTEAGMSLEELLAGVREQRAKYLVETVGSKKPARSKSRR